MVKTILFFSLWLSLAFSAFSQETKDADLAGSWYPDNQQELRRKLNDYFEKAQVSPGKGEIIALISPHAGMVYSGEVAAYGFKAVEDKAIDTVIVVGFSHQRDYEGIAVFDQDGFITPLGVLNNDKALAGELCAFNQQIFWDSLAFEQENSVELILPFLQTALGNPKIVLLAMGRQTWQNCQILGQALSEVLKNREDFLLVASTDMSHYLTKEQAEKIDAQTVELIKQFEPEALFLKAIGSNRMCGAGAVVSTMIAAQKLGANKVQILKRSTSAESSGETKRVVGYLSAALVKEDGKKSDSEEAKMGKLLNAEQRKRLIELARDTIELYLKEGKTLPVNIDDPVLNQTMGVFVTLHKDGQLRGCIGNIVGTKPLCLGVRDMAIAASTEDPRFPVVTADELAKLDIEISVLSPLKEITDPDEITLGTHGVLIKSGFNSGVYLPQVATETGWSKEEFMNSLCAHKAGLEPSAWKKGQCKIYIFTAEVFAED